MERRLPRAKSSPCEKKVPLRKSRRHEDAHTQAMTRSQHTLERETTGCK